MYLYTHCWLFSLKQPKHKHRIILLKECWQYWYTKNACKVGLIWILDAVATSGPRTHRRPVANLTLAWSSYWVLIYLPTWRPIDQAKNSAWGQEHLTANQCTFGKQLRTTLSISLILIESSRIQGNFPIISFWDMSKQLFRSIMGFLLAVLTAKKTNWGCRKSSLSYYIFSGRNGENNEYVEGMTMKTCLLAKEWAAAVWWLEGVVVVVAGNSVANLSKTHTRAHQLSNFTLQVQCPCNSYTCATRMFILSIDVSVLPMSGHISIPDFGKSNKVEPVLLSLPISPQAGCSRSANAIIAGKLPPCKGNRLATNWKQNENQLLLNKKNKWNFRYLQ